MRMSMMSSEKIYARSEGAREKGFKAGDFSYNTGKLRCPVCDGTGVISLDVQFLPDVEIPSVLPWARAMGRTQKHPSCDKKEEAKSLPELMDMEM